MYRRKYDRKIQSNFDRKIQKIGKMQLEAETISNQTVTEVISGALNAAVSPFIRADKYVASKIKRNPRAARNWLDGHNAPGAAELIELMREFDEVYHEVLRLANRKSIEPTSGSHLHNRIEKAMQILNGEENDNDRY